MTSDDTNGPASDAWRRLAPRGLSLGVLESKSTSYEGQLDLRRLRRLGTVSAGYQLTKRLLDVTICLAILPLVLPVVAVCCALVWWESPGPVLFTQLRTGKRSRRFRMWKIRTMVVNAEELKKRYAHLNELTWPDFKITNDPRMTRVGRFLRRTSLDELPQIINVLSGDMSLVGPRPTSFAADTYELWQTERLEVLPGVTGLWQVRGRSDIDFEERVRLDIAYIERRSFWLDVRILCETLIALGHGAGAR